MKKQDLQKVASTLKLAVVESEDFEDRCFQLVLESIRKGNLDDLRPITKEISSLRSSDERTLITEAIMNRDETLFEALMSMRIDFNVYDEEGNSPLHEASREGALSFVGKLWEYVPLDHENHLGQTCLHAACFHGQDHIVSALLQNGASCESRGRYQFGEETFSVTPLQLAVICGHKDCVDALLPRSDVNSSVETVGHILHLAIHFYQTPMFNHLLTTHFERTQSLVNTPRRDGLTPLMLASFLGEGEALALLNEKGVNLEQKDRQGRGALHWAVIGKQRASIEILSYFNLNLQAVDKEGKRPIDLLQEDQDPESQALLALFTNLMKQKDILDQSPPIFSFRPPENLVFKGGGPKGIAYVGAVEVLEKKGVLGHVKRVAGTSAGAINSTLLALQYSASDMKKILNETDLTSFLDHPFKMSSLTKALEDVSFGSAFQFLYNLVKNPTKIITGPIKSLWHCKGACEGEEFRKWMDGLIQEKTGIEFCSFGEFRALIEKGRPFKHLHVFTMRLDQNELIHLSSDDPKWKDIIISDAVRASMSIPGVFKPHTLHEKDFSGHRVPAPQHGCYLDGGMLNNFPIDAFDKKKYQTSMPLGEEGEYHLLNKRTLGFSLFSPEPELQEVTEIKTVKDLLAGIVGIYFDAEQIIRNQTPYNHFRKIEISNCGVGTLSFNLDDDKKEELCDSGRLATQKFYHDQEEKCSQAQALFLYPRVVKKAQGRLELKKPHPDFAGRKSYLDLLNQNLLAGRNSNVPVYALWGEGGIGKSEIAIAFGNAHLNDFSIIFSIDCENQETLLNSYMDLAKRLRLSVQENEPIEKVQRKVHRCLEQDPFPLPWLLIFDQIEESFELPQRGNGSILMTTRSKKPWDGVEFVEVKPLEMEESFELLEKITHAERTKEWKELVEELGGIPLALNQAAHFIAETPGMTEASYLNLFKQNRFEMLNQMQPSQRYDVTLPVSWKITKDRLEELSPKALRLLRVCAYFSSRSIPREWIDKWVKQNFIQLGAFQRAFLRDDIVRTLSSYALIQFDEAEETFRIQQLRQEMLRNDPTCDQESCQIEAIALLACLVAELKTRESLEWYSKHWSRLKRWGPHASECLSRVPEQIALKGGTHLFNAFGNLLWMKGRYHQAEESHQKALSLFDKDRDTDPMALTVRHNLAWDLERQGKSREALALFETVRKLRVATLGDQHPDIADSDHGIGWAQGSLSDYRGAAASFKEALGLRIKSYGEFHPSVVGTLHDLGWALEKQGDSANARHYYEKALSIREKVSEDLHPRNEISYKHNLGRVLERENKYKEALKLHQEAYILNQEVYGLDHPYILDSLQNLLRVYEVRRDKKNIEKTKEKIEELSNKIS